MKVKDWLAKATLELAQAGIATARLDALILLEDVTQKDRAWLLAHPEHRLGSDPKQIELLQNMIERRARHEPLAYIRGKSEFYGREFSVSPATLQPRPETETMINLLLGVDLPAEPVFADIGTGSGAIAISAKLELPDATVLATEIQPEALKIARANAEQLHAEVAFYKGNLLQPVSDQKIDVILANLPYVPDDHTINDAAMQEPAVAIFGGKDGLDLYRALFDQLGALQKAPAYILTESLPFQHEELTANARSHQYLVTRTEDFIQVFSFNGN